MHFPLAESSPPESKGKIERGLGEKEGGVGGGLRRRGGNQALGKWKRAAKQVHPTGEIQCVYVESKMAASVRVCARAQADSHQQAVL